MGEKQLDSKLVYDRVEGMPNSLEPTFVVIITCIWQYKSQAKQIIF